MIGRIECKGAPRDLGFDQGSALRDSVREELKIVERETVGGRFGWLRLSRRRAARRRVATVERDLLRFFPQQADRLAGMAAGVRCSRKRLVGPLVREFSDGTETGLRVTGGLLLAVDPKRGPGHPLLGGTVDLSAKRSMLLALRHSQPDHGMASIELVLPWMASGLAGVNEAGFGIAVASGPSTDLHQQVCAASGIHLLQDCLQSCDGVEKAIEWCSKRPAGGVVSLLFADASGEVAGIVIKGDRRTVLRPDSGLLVGLSHPDRRRTLEIACRDRPALNVEQLHSVFSTHSEGGVQVRSGSVCRHGGPTETQASFYVDVEKRELTLLEGRPCETDLAQKQTFGLAVSESAG